VWVWERGFFRTGEGICVCDQIGFFFPDVEGDLCLRPNFLFLGRGSDLCLWPNRFFWCWVFWVDCFFGLVYILAGMEVCDDFDWGVL